MTVTVFLSDGLKSNAEFVRDLLIIIDNQVRDHFQDGDLQMLGWCTSYNLEKANNSIVFSWINVLPNRVSKKNGENKTVDYIQYFSHCSCMSCSFLYNCIG